MQEEVEVNQSALRMNIVTMLLQYSSFDSDGELLTAAQALEGYILGVKEVAVPTDCATKTKVPATSPDECRVDEQLQRYLQESVQLARHVMTVLAALREEKDSPTATPAPDEEPPPNASHIELFGMISAAVDVAFNARKEKAEQELSDFLKDLAKTSRGLSSRAESDPGCCGKDRDD